MLSEEFIWEFKDKVTSERISFDRILTENFVHEFKDKVDFDNIFGILNKDLEIISIDEILNDDEVDLETISSKDEI